MLGPMNDPHGDVYQSPATDGVFEARCIKRPSWARTYGKKEEYRHDSPAVDCTCGFYAHYEEWADFYRQGVWTAEPLSYVANFSGYHAFAGSLQPQSGIGYGMVRAVVELSGKVVMGSLGVRAQKLKVKALAVDWGKFHRQPVRDYWEWDAEGVGGIYQGDGFREEVVVPSIRRHPNYGENRAGYERLCSTAAARLGAEYFYDANVMYGKYPRPDLSSLGIAPAKPKPLAEPPIWITMPSYRVSQHAATQVQAYLYRNGFTASLSIIDEVTADAVSVMDEADSTPQGVVPDSRLAKVIEARKNRPAPPGTGIDRRKRKL